MVGRMFFGFVVVIMLLALTQTVAAQSEGEVPAIEILEARLGTGIQDRELVGDTASFEFGAKVYLWLKAANAETKELTISWSHGSARYTTQLAIGGSPWRTWAYKTVALSGEWVVRVSDAQGNTLKEIPFTVK